MSESKLIKVTVTTRSVITLNPSHNDLRDRDPAKMVAALQAELESSKVKRTWLMCEECHNVKITVKQTAAQARASRQ